MARTATASGYFYVDCPSCKQGIQWPFLTSSPTLYAHEVNRPRQYGGRTKCRIVVWPDPENGHHRAYRIPDGMSVEEAAPMVARKWREERAA